MNYEEKYKMALEGIQEILNSGEDSIKMSRLQLRLQGIFTELKKSEDDTMIELFKNLVAMTDKKILDEILTKYEKTKDDIISWLEKQGKEEYTLKSSKDEDVRKFMQYIEKLAKAYEFNLPNRSYDIYAFAKDILVWFEKQGEQTFNIQWHDVNEEPKEGREIFCEWDSSDATWHDVAMYHAKTKTYLDCERQIKGIVKWAYVDEMLEQGKQKEYTFKSLPRLLDMIEPTSKTKEYLQKLIDILEKEGYSADAKIVGDRLKEMNGEEVPMATMDEIQGEKRSDIEVKTVK